MYLAEKAKIFFPGGDTHRGKKKMISKKVTMVRKVFQNKKNEKNLKKKKFSKKNFKKKFKKKFQKKIFKKKISKKI